MIVHEVEQGTEAWLSLRLGMPTASAFAKVYSATCKVPKAFDDYCYQLAAEKVTGKRTEVYVNDHMRRGTELEPVAVSAYEFIMDEETEVIGFVTNDEQTIGCSPDRMHLEIKCPAAHNHARYLAEGKCPSQYFPQVQGCIAATSWNRAGKLTAARTRATWTTPSSSGCRRTSSARRRNSGSSSKNSTP